MRQQAGQICHLLSKSTPAQVMGEGDSKKPPPGKGEG